MRPQDFLQTAKQLANSEFEADLRSSVSRAYYAALHTALEALPDDKRPNLRAHNSSTHEKVIGAYDLWSRPAGNNRTSKREIKEALIEIKKLRKKADYELKALVDANDVCDSLEYAAEVIKLTTGFTLK